MEKNTVLHISIGLIAGIILTLLFTRSPYAPAVNNMMGRVKPNTAMKAAGIDKHFIEEMIPHHEGAIEMAQLAKERSQRQEILTLADDIIESQTAENEQMRNWYKDWFGEEVVVDNDVQIGMGRGMMHGGMMGDESDIHDLKQAEDFDSAFLREMIPHHQMAVMMAQMLLSSTERPEMKQLAENIIEAQEAEIEQMRGWLTDWGQ